MRKPVITHTFSHGDRQLPCSLMLPKNNVHRLPLSPSFQVIIAISPAKSSKSCRNPYGYTLNTGRHSAFKTLRGYICSFGSRTIGPVNFLINPEQPTPWRQGANRLETSPYRFNTSSDGQMVIFLKTDRNSEAIVR